MNSTRLPLKLFYLMRLKFDACCYASTSLGECLSEHSSPWLSAIWTWKLRQVPPTSGPSIDSLSAWSGNLYEALILVLMKLYSKCLTWQWINYCEVLSNKIRKESRSKNSRQQFPSHRRRPATSDSPRSSPGWPPRLRVLRRMSPRSMARNARNTSEQGSLEKWIIHGQYTGDQRRGWGQR